MRIISPGSTIFLLLFDGGLRVPLHTIVPHSNETHWLSVHLRG
jgi:hypothetical protein